MELSGKNALVCGASQGIGAAIARILADQGCRVTIVARSRAKLEQVLTSLNGDGHRQEVLDLTDLGRVRAFSEREVSERGQVNIVINNTGGPPAGKIAAAASATFSDSLLHHLGSAQEMLQVFLPGMQASGYGRIVNVLSTSVKAPIPNLGVSNVTRSAMAAWAKTLASEVGGGGITVNNVLPGYTETPRLEALLRSAAERSGTSVTEVRSLWKAKVPLGRFAQADEVAQAVAFLAGPKAAYISGINLPVDGGRTGTL